MPGTLYENALGTVRVLQEHGHEAYFVGGCVRDQVMGLEPHDYDIVTDARPDRVEGLFRRTVAVGKAFGVILVLKGRHSFEVATFRADGRYADGRRPDSVRFGSAREDVLRRDFTLNGMLYDPTRSELLDWVGGREDIRRGRIRAIGDPAVRFREDRLRMLRAVRFASRFDYEIEPETAAAVAAEAPTLPEISWERIGEEIVKTLVGPHAGRALRLMRQLGLLAACLPEIDALAGVEQPPEFHPEGDVFEHTCLMLNALERPSAELALGVLLHDVGKPETFAVSDRIRFDRHDKAGTEIAQAVCRRLRCSNARAERVVALVENHMRFMAVRDMKESTFKRFIGMPHFGEHLELHRLDCACSHGDTSNLDYVARRSAAIPPEQISPRPLLTGRDLIRMGYAPGPSFGAILSTVEEEQLEGRLETPEEAASFVLRAFPPTGEGGA